MEKKFAKVSMRERVARSPACTGEKTDFVQSMTKALNRVCIDENIARRLILIILLQYSPPQVETPKKR